MLLSTDTLLCVLFEPFRSVQRGLVPLFKNSKTCRPGYLVFFNNSETPYKLQAGFYALHDISTPRPMYQLHNTCLFTSRYQSALLRLTNHLSMQVHRKCNTRRVSFTITQSRWVEHVTINVWLFIHWLHPLYLDKGKEGSQFAFFLSLHRKPTIYSALTTHYYQTYP